MRDLRRREFITLLGWRGGRLAARSACPAAGADATHRRLMNVADGEASLLRDRSDRPKLQNRLTFAHQTQKARRADHPPSRIIPSSLHNSE
jgi:hypothetical protein